jgi:hypothetical protein
MKTAKDIAAALLAAPRFDEETLADIHEYRRLKRESGAPMDLENEVLHAAHCCQHAHDALRDYLHRAAAEATEGLGHMEHAGVKYQRIWYTLDTRKNAETLGETLRATYDRFRNIVEAWAAVADRIQATPEERDAAETGRLARAWSQLGLKDIRAFAKRKGFDPSGGRGEIVERLVRAGMTPEAT